MGEVPSLKLTVTPTALAEIDAILAYVYERSPQGADRIAERLDAFFALLLRNPHLGKRTSKGQVRRIVLPRLPYLVFYEARGATLIVIAVRHAARRPSSMPGH